MKLPRMSFGHLPKPAFMCTKEKGRVHYIPTARHAARKITAGLLSLLGTAAFSCSVLAASMCQTFLPCIGLLILGILLCIVAYCQYAKAWTRIEIPKLHYRKPSISSITEKEYLSLLRRLRFLSPGMYCHQVNRKIFICEGTKENLRKILAKRADKKNGTILIQELDLDAIRRGQLETETVYQDVFQLPTAMKECVKNSLKTSCRQEKMVSSPWLDRDHGPVPQEVIYTHIPGVRQEKSPMDVSLLSIYTEAYIQAFKASIERVVVSRIVNKEGICLLVSPLGVVKGLSDEALHAVKILSKTAFLQAVESLAMEAVLPENKSKLPITIVLVDPDSVAPLRSVDTNVMFSSRESLSFSDFVPSDSSWCRVI
ncbi:conserved hypothetical protein [Chlamydia felis Fe/C-56]|uniref:Uncharacterized protein n=1 Tax=Chlamydia felis (strain Fe/C-56) TaxID=264202 RepID=Q253D6_CHLFF|nr:hypothetical protein [Chlamydia felis]BAE81602.1 conserved hypothetical protein [Chlamydia felis Fe/C-56]